MIIEDNLREYNSKLLKINYFREGVIFDCNVLLVFFLSKYIMINPNKKYLLPKINITYQQIDCVNNLLVNLKISKIIVTPYILSEFFNKIRSKLKEDYKDIKRECMKDLENFGEIHILKNNLLKHKDFIDFGNDISLVLATEEQINKFKFSCIMSFDDRFIQNSFRKTGNNVLAFNLSVLQHII